MSISGKSPAVLPVVLLSAMLLSACGGDATDEEADDQLSEITGAINDGRELQEQAYEAEQRLNQHCMSAEGFDVHPEIEKDDGDIEEFKIVGGDAPEISEVPSVEQAGKRGMGVSDMYDPNGTSEEDEAEADEETYVEDPFDEQPEEYQTEYDIALMGKEVAKQLANEEKGAEFSTKDLAGCMRETFETMYGSYDGNDEEAEADGDYWSSWSLQTPSIMNYGEPIEAYESDTVLDSRDEWLLCVEDRGHPYLSVHADNGYDEGETPPSEYAGFFYYTADDLSDGLLQEMHGDIKPPEGLPFEDFDAAREAEFAFATDVAECADSSGYRKTMQTEWEATLTEMALEQEAEIFAWRDGMQTAIENAQKAMEK